MKAKQTTAARWSVGESGCDQASERSRTATRSLENLQHAKVQSLGNGCSPKRQWRLLGCRRSAQETPKMEPTRYRKYMTVYGSYDTVVLVEADTLRQIHDAINNMTRKGGVLYTTTSVVVDPDFSTRCRIDVNGHLQACVGICTLPAKQMGSIGLRCGYWSKRVVLGTCRL